MGPLLGALQDLLPARVQTGPREASRTFQPEGSPCVREEAEAFRRARDGSTEGRGHSRSHGTQSHGVQKANWEPDGDLGKCPGGSELQAGREDTTSGGRGGMNPR